MDEAGSCCVEVQGLTVHSIGHGAQRMRGALYEYQWKFAPRQAAGGGRNSRHLPSPDALAPVVQQEGEVLRQRFNRLRYQSEFQSLSRATAAAYIVHALRELGWTPASDEALPIEQLAERLGMAPQYHRWLRLHAEGAYRRRDCFDARSRAGCGQRRGTSSRNARPN